ncbi:MAG: hypothetical protein KA004_14665 [Verrucomicrobiales bacterium]|nr:hypothetical protein [Verrucomicrobiales bacterium]
MFLPRIFLLFPLAFLVGCTTASGPVQGGSGVAGLTPETIQKIGRRTWQNECGGTVAGLTSWNSGEHFASLGIGHFIWYPAGATGPYEESFPALVRFLEAGGVSVPAWMHGPCPWPSRAVFHQQSESPRMRQLRQMLASTVNQQAEFLSRRFLAGIRKIPAAAPAPSRAAVEGRIQALSGTASGLYAMMDYVNFKGEGTNPAERYQGQGWGLQQVLLEMHGQPQGQAAAVEFSRAAQRVLDRRIRLAPKNESQWRAGWFSRCAGYARPF